MDRQEIAAVLASAGLHPRHQFGQNFMVDQNVLRAIVEAGAVAPDDVILEVGPGVGNLTRPLAQAASGGAVLAVDIDRKLLPAAQRHHAELRNVTWLNADVLAGKHAIEPRVLDALRDLRAAHPSGEIKLVSNLPYNAASPLVAELLVEMWRELRPRSATGSQDAERKSKIEHRKSKILFSRLAFTVQWEVALRMAAAPDTRDYGPLGVLIQALADVALVRKIPPGAFWPPPKVHSALVVVTPDRERMARVANVPEFQQFLASIFSHRRQTLGNALKHHLGPRWTPTAKEALAAWDLGQRPENLSVEALRQVAARCSNL
jgi:16S rRNA (adenine1518-N6/adenine1519-N6)-dimethyltransferase